YETMLTAVFARETPQIARLRWYKRVNEKDARDRAVAVDAQKVQAAAIQTEAVARQNETAARQAEAVARQAEVTANKRANDLEIASAERDRLLLVELHSPLERNARSLRLGLVAARSLRS